MSALTRTIEENTLDPNTGYRYIVAFLRHDHVSCRAGYVIVPPDHVAYGKPHHDPVFDALTVHGGVAYANSVQAFLGVPFDGWVVGFTCNHDGDVPDLSDHPSPDSQLIERFSRPVGDGVCETGGHVWTFEDTKWETLHLAAQLTHLHELEGQ